MRKGCRLSELDKLWVMEGGLKGLDRVPLCHINKAEPGVGHKAPVEPRRNVAGLPRHEGFRRFPLCQKLFVLALGHFEGIDEDHRWHGYAPFVRRRRCSQSLWIITGMGNEKCPLFPVIFPAYPCALSHTVLTVQAPEVACEASPKNASIC